MTSKKDTLPRGRPRGRPLGIRTGWKPITIRFDPEFYRQIKHACIDAEMTLQDFVHAAIEAEIVRRA